MEHKHLKQRCQRLNLRSGDLASLVGLSAPKLSNFFRGRITLDAAKRKDLIQTLTDLETLRTYFPVPIGGDAGELSIALDRFRAGRFESFRKLTQAINWTLPEGLERTFPKLFKK